MTQWPLLLWGPGDLLTNNCCTPLSQRPRPLDKGQVFLPWPGLIPPNPTLCLPFGCAEFSLCFVPAIFTYDPGALITLTSKRVQSLGGRGHRGPGGLGGRGGRRRRSPARSGGPAACMPLLVAETEDTRLGSAGERASRPEDGTPTRTSAHGATGARTEPPKAQVSPQEATRPQGQPSDPGPGAWGPPRLPNSSHPPGVPACVVPCARVQSPARAEAGPTSVSQTSARRHGLGPQARGACTHSRQGPVCTPVTPHKAAPCCRHSGAASL